MGCAAGAVAILASGSGAQSTGRAGSRAAGADAARIQRDIATLAADRWEGRVTCTPGNDSAAAYIAQRFASLGLIPAGSVDSATGRTGFLHHYIARPQGAEHLHLPARCAAQNVVGMVRGTDAALRDKYVIVGGHFDHLGRGSIFATDAAARDSIHNGADDNASGTAAVMELARLFSGHPTKRSLIFITFSGEEWGTLGSEEYVKTAMPPRAGIEAMVNFDMVGRLRGDTLLVYGTGTATEMPALLAAHNTGTPFLLRLIPDGFGPSDQTSFYADSIAVLHFFTNTHPDYHAATDVASKINSPGEARVIDYAARVIRDLGDRAERLSFVSQPPPRPMNGGGNVYLGSVPDMAAGDVPGLRLSGVTPGSPADKGGLKGGDLVVELGGKPVTDLQSYSEALYAHKPGDVVSVVVVRGGARVTLHVTLGSR